MVAAIASAVKPYAGFGDLTSPASFARCSTVPDDAGYRLALPAYRIDRLDPQRRRHGGAVAAVTLSARLDVANRPATGPTPRPVCAGETMLLGIIVRDISDPFFAPAVEAVSTASESNYNVVLGSAHGLADEAIGCTACSRRHCDGIIPFGDMRTSRGCSTTSPWPPSPSSPSGRARPPRDRHGQRRQPGRHSPRRRPPVGLGHRRFGFIGGGSHGDLRGGRRSSRLRDLGMPRHGHMVPAINDPAAGAEASGSGLSRRIRRRRSTATDLLALGALHRPQPRHRVPMRPRSSASTTSRSLPTGAAAHLVHNLITEMASLVVDLAIAPRGRRTPGPRPHPTFTVRRRPRLPPELATLSDRGG